MRRGVFRTARSAASRRDRRRRAGLHRARQRGAGLRDRGDAGRAAVAPERRRQDGRHAAGELARGRSLPQRAAGQRLPRASRGGRRGVEPADRALEEPGSVEHEHLQPVAPHGRLRLPDHPRRHQARRQRPPAAGRGRRAAAAGRRRAADAPRGSHADPDRVLRLRVRRPGRASERHRGPGQPDGLHGGRREHARHGLLGRRLRLLRAAAEPRRLRRGRDRRPPAVGAPRQGRDDGDLLRRDQPALHGLDQPSEPRRDRAVLGHRQHADDALPGRRPQHRASPSRGLRSGSTTRRRPRPRAGSPGPTSGSRRATRPARPTRPSIPRRWT